MFRLPSKWCEVAELKFPACQQLVIPLFLGLYLHLLPFSFVFFISGCRQLSKSYFQYFERSYSIFLQLKQNLLQTHYFFKSPIFQVCQNHKWNNTHSYLTIYYSAVTCNTALFQAEVTQQTLADLCLVLGVCARSSNVILRSVTFLITPYIHLI